MGLLDRITIDPEIVHGRPHVRGTRIRVSDVLWLLASGAGESEILEDYPFLTSQDISACLAYAAAQAGPAIAWSESTPTVAKRTELMAGVSQPDPQAG